MYAQYSTRYIVRKYFNIGYSPDRAQITKMADKDANLHNHIHETEKPMRFLVFITLLLRDL